MCVFSTVRVHLPACVRVAWADKLTACAEREGVKQAAAVVGLPTGGQGFLLPLCLCLSLAFILGVFCIDMGGLTSLTHTLYTHSIGSTLTERLQMVVWLSKEIRCQMKYWKGNFEWQFCLLTSWFSLSLSLSFFLSLYLSWCQLEDISRTARLTGCPISEFLTQHFNLEKPVGPLDKVHLLPKALITITHSTKAVNWAGWYSRAARFQKFGVPRQKKRCSSLIVFYSLIHFWLKVGQPLKTNYSNNLQENCVALCLLAPEEILLVSYNTKNRQNIYWLLMFTQTWFLELCFWTLTW